MAELTIHPTLDSQLHCSLNSEFFRPGLPTKDLRDPTMISIKLEALGERLKEERTRLGLSQEHCSQHAGINRMSQSRYETGVTLPGLDYLARLGDLQFDTTYIIFGKRSASCVFIDDPLAYSRAIDFVDELTARHGFEPPPGFRVRAISQAYRHLRAHGAGRPQLTLKDLLTDLSESTAGVGD